VFRESGLHGRSARRASRALAATATAGGGDKVEFYNGSDFWWVTEPDSILDISSVWNADRARTDRRLHGKRRSVL
jgi:hypothetical protein